MRTWPTLADSTLPMNTSCTSSPLTPARSNAPAVLLACELRCVRPATACCRASTCRAHQRWLLTRAAWPSATPATPGKRRLGSGSRQLCTPLQRDVESAGRQSAKGGIWRRADRNKHLHLQRLASPRTPCSARHRPTTGSWAGGASHRVTTAKDSLRSSTDKASARPSSHGC